MDTGGKIATGIFVPLAVGGAAVAAYFLLVPKKMNIVWTTSKAPSIKPVMVGGNRRRTHRRRR